MQLIANLILIWLMVLFCVFIIVRMNTAEELKDKDSSIRKSLPSRDAMTLHPKYWHLWTKKHWMAWVVRNEVQGG